MDDDDGFDVVEYEVNPVKFSWRMVVSVFLENQANLLRDLSLVLVADFHYQREQAEFHEAATLEIESITSQEG